MRARPPSRPRPRRRPRAARTGAGGTVVTHCRDLPNGGSTCGARSGWLVRDADAPWLGAPFAETTGSGGDIAAPSAARTSPVGSTDSAARGLTTRASAARARRDDPPGLTDPLAPGRAFCRSASPGGGRTLLDRVHSPRRRRLAANRAVDAIHSTGLPRPGGRLPLRRGTASAATGPSAPRLRAGRPHRCRPRPAACLPTRRRLPVRAPCDGEACWAPRPNITQHRPAIWHLP